MIYISQAAAKEIKRVQISRQQPDSLFRLSIKTGGCSGLFYSFELELPLSTNDSSEKSTQDDLIYQSNGINIIIDKSAALYLKNLQLDYSEDLMGGSFRFQNPNATASCSCGLSFSVD
jgi:iron-sulfur cluster assembly accessory protein